MKGIAQRRPIEYRSASPSMKHPMYPFMARTAHASPDGVQIIEHNTPVKSHPAIVPEPSPSLPLGTGIHGAFNIITSNCELRHGLSAFAFAKETGDNSTLRFLTNIQQMERGNIGAGVVEIRRVKSQRFECFYDELEKADALTDTDMSDRWGHEESNLPRYTYGYKGPRTRYKNYTTDYERAQIHNVCHIQCMGKQYAIPYTKPRAVFTQVATPRH